MTQKAFIAPIGAVVLTAVSVLLPQSQAQAENLPYYDVTINGTWDCRDRAGTFLGTLVLAEESYAWLKTDGRLGGYGKLKMLSFDTHLPNFVLISGPLKDEFGAGGGGMAGPRDDFEDISGELFITLAVSPRREDAWYCTGRHLPEGLI